MTEIFVCSGCGGKCHLEVKGTDNDTPPGCPYGYDAQAFGKWVKDE